MHFEQHNVHVSLPSPRAGYKLTVLDGQSDKDWWQGQLSETGAVGFFPATYALRMRAGERPLQVLQALQIPAYGGAGAAAGEPIKLLRDQVGEKTGSKNFIFGRESTLVL